MNSIWSGTVERMGLLPIFVEVVRQGSFTAAASRLGMPKSTVSRRVIRLEQMLGVELLTRTTRHLRLTQAGAELYDEAAPALEQLEDAARAASERRRALRGTLRVTVPADLSPELLTSVIGSFVRRHPKARLDVVITNRVVDLAAEGFDVAIRAGRLPDSATLVARRLGPFELGLFATPAYLERRGHPRTVAELARHECVLLRSPTGQCRWTLRGPSGDESVEVRGALIVDDLTFGRAAIEAGVGIGLVPVSASRAGGARPATMERVLAAHTIAAGSSYLVYPAVRHMPATLKAFRDHVLESFAAASARAGETELEALALRASSSSRPPRP